jgi:dephospho-CoA kinase
MIRKIGVTGGIGSGKSTVARVLETMGYPVFYSDKAAKEIMHSNPEVRKGLIELFGIEAYTSQGTGELNRAYLSEIIFKNPGAIQQINALVHPRVRESFNSFCEKHRDLPVFNEAAILFETGAYKTFDATFLVTCPLETRIQRVMQRDNLPREAIEARMNNQWTDEQKLPLATFVIENAADSKVLPQVLEVLEKIK